MSLIEVGNRFTQSLSFFTKCDVPANRATLVHEPSSVCVRKESMRTEEVHIYLQFKQSSRKISYWFKKLMDCCGKHTFLLLYLQNS